LDALATDRPDDAIANDDMVRRLALVLDAVEAVLHGQAIEDGVVAVVELTTCRARRASWSFGVGAVFEPHVERLVRDVEGVRNHVVTEKMPSPVARAMERIGVLEHGHDWLVNRSRVDSALDMCPFFGRQKR